MKSPYIQCRKDGRKSRMHRELCRVLYELNRDQYPLPFDEYVVHHRNGDKTDNSMKNLVLLTDAEHKRIHARLMRRVDGRFAR